MRRLRNRTIDIEDPSDKKARERIEESRKRIQLSQEENVCNTLNTSSSNLVINFIKKECKLNSYVLGHMFSFLDLGSLKNCRLVSKTWNEEASRKLGDRSWSKINWHKLHPKVWNLEHYPRLNLTPSDLEEGALTNEQKEQKGKKKSNKLFKCLNGLQNSSVFTNFEFDIEWLTNKKFQELLEKYGSLIKRIIIRERKQLSRDEPEVDFSARMNIVSQILTKWCPNLINFQFETVRETKGRTVPPKLKWVQPNNIRELGIEGTLTKYKSNFWIQLIKTCPSLTILSVSGIPGGYNCPPKFIKSCETLFEQLSKLTEVTKKLEEFSWNGDWIRFFSWVPPYQMFGVENKTSCDIMKPVSNMEFSNKLRKIGIGPSIDSSNETGKYMKRLLEKLNACGTQEIVINGVYDKALSPEEEQYFSGPLACGCEVDKHKLECLCKIDHIPLMPKVTSIISSAENNYTLGAFHFVHKFPNLKTYDKSSYFGYSYEVSEDEIFTAELHYMSKFPHFNLRKLIVNVSLLKRKTLEGIIKGFPELTFLYLKVGLVRRKKKSKNYGGPLPRNEIAFEETLSMVSRLEHLKELTVSFRSKYSPEDLCEALGFVKDFPKLERLTLNGWECIPKVSLENVVPGLFQLSNLPTSVRLVGFEVTELEMAQMEKYCEKHHILAKFMPDVENQFPHPGPDY